MAREAPSRWGPAGIGGLLHPSREASRGAVRIGSSRGADSPAHDHGHESLKCRLSQWETSALNFGGTCAFPGSAPLGAGAALTVRLEALGSTGRNRGVSFRCLGSRQSVFQDTWCLFLTFIRPHTPKPWLVSGKGRRQSRGKGSPSPGARGRSQGGGTDRPAVREPRGRAGGSENRALARRGGRAAGAQLGFTHARGATPAAVPASRRGPALRARREIRDRAGRAVCCIPLEAVLPAGCHPQFYPEPLPSESGVP